MEVILRETIPNLGRVGEIVKVKDGYGRNYLIPQGKAYLATKGNKRQVEAESKHRAVRTAAEQSDAETVAAQLDSLELHFTARAGEGDKLFGSITSADIAGQLGDLGYSVDKRAVELEEPIKMIGVYKVPVRLHPEVRAEVRVWVVKE
ncbi:MAG: 50S ribosomal protein L9 [Gemmatimonadales bacterium]|nr:50S ribosomal protein L9 [Gemmatimonadales bacterium]NIN12334.1 50S ribosomal protein L9 [Gemmatimonadales bacterium]NIN48872.1 50S ribosomal protein L9 [Gemmatimonadales bacterium]NIP06336.1 50S ribosomal protein L9 [Gemmatimonadales bacterium]NIR00708.1 50S ribosomal protein L9 [Gemmatimonadales bacterium]